MVETEVRALTELCARSGERVVSRHYCGSWCRGRMPACFFTVAVDSRRANAVINRLSPQMVVV